MWAFKFGVLAASWALVREAFPNSGFTLDVLCLAFIFPAWWAVDRINEQLLWEEPKRRLGIGFAVLLVTMGVFVAIITLIPLRDAPVLGDTFDQIILTAAALLFGGGTILSIMLLASGFRQTFKRWRHYRRVGR